MGFTEAVRLFFKNYVNFQGRSRRAEYWWPFLMNFIVAVVLYSLMVSGSGLGAILYGLFSLAVLLPSISVVVRRLHDLDKSGWWYFIALVPLIGPILLIYWFCQPGTSGPNQYGPDPKGGHDVTVFE
ncbi:DUF805 domain-containing protein [Hyphomonas sp. FCG-A18]|jgi:uncharacterized membrane protein YhaH (DUF805 family)|uniref:DUF805 domain-containing protein n=1 Tax=Hyphomonas sp. FCG-A18 TaxID=3080019 RepID=UPI002B2A0F60|nr:DUF805 domain-containing protein [Hyphomonas sp. FCG-A18]